MNLLVASSDYVIRHDFFLTKPRIEIVITECEEVLVSDQGKTPEDAKADAHSGSELGRTMRRTFLSHLGMVELLASAGPIGCKLGEQSHTDPAQSPDLENTVGAVHYPTYRMK